MTGENVSEVLDVHGAFDAACRKVADFRKYAADEPQNDEYHRAHRYAVRKSNVSDGDNSI